MVQKGVQKWEHGLTTRIFRQNSVIFHLFLRLGPSDHLEWREVVKKGPKIDPFFGSFSTLFCVFSRHPSYWRLKYEGHKISGEKVVQKVAKNGQKWPIFGSFLGHFCHVLPSKLGNLGTPKKWPKMAKNDLFLVIFDHLLDHFICVCLILRPNYGHIWVKHEKSVQKVVQKWVISGVPRSAEPPKVDILASKHQILSLIHISEPTRPY